jgi:hypothetical protein
MHSTNVKIGDFLFLYEKPVSVLSCHSSVLISCNVYENFEQDYTYLNLSINALFNIYMHVHAHTRA